MTEHGYFWEIGLNKSAMESILFSKVFWGAVVVLIGISIIAQAIFKINIPIFKIGVALVLIYIGVRMLTNSFGFSTSNIMSDQEIVVEHLNEHTSYDVVMGNQKIDLTQMDLSGELYTIECNVVMGASIILLPKRAQVDISSSVVLGSVRDPGGKEFVSGKDHQMYGDGLSNARIDVKLNVVLGSAEIRYP